MKYIGWFVFGGLVYIGLLFLAIGILFVITTSINWLAVQFGLIPDMYTMEQRALASYHWGILWATFAAVTRGKTWVKFGG